MKHTNKNLWRSWSIAVVASIICISPPAHAGGLYVGEFGHPNQGASRAGANAIAEDASTALTNPSGVMFLDGPKSMATGLIINSETDFDQSQTFPGTNSAVANGAGTGPAGDGGEAGGTSVGGAYFYAHPVNEKWGWGVTFGSLSGAVIDYESGANFAGRYWASEVNLLTVNLTGSISYKFNDVFSASVHSAVSYGELDMDLYAPGPFPGSPDIGKVEIQDGDDTAFSFGASALWQVTDSLRLGAIYNSEIEYDFDSDLDLSDLPPATTVGANVEVTWYTVLKLGPVPLRGKAEALELCAVNRTDHWRA
jgi:long-chain fatty acid transport protein